MYDLYDTHFAILAYFALIFPALLQLFYYFFFHVVFVYNCCALIRVIQLASSFISIDFDA